MLSTRLLTSPTLRTLAQRPLTAGPTACFATGTIGRTLSKTREALDRSKDARDRRKREIFESVSRRPDKNTSKIRADTDFGVRAIFDQQVQSTAGEMLEDKADTMREAGHTSVIYFVGDQSSLEECARMMKQLKIGAVIAVNSEQNISGLLTERDFVKAAASSNKYPTAGSLMTPVENMVHVGPDSGLGECLELMRQHQIRHLPVLSSDAAHETTRRKLAAAQSQFEAAREAVRLKRNAMVDALGTQEGGKLSMYVEANAETYDQDERPVVKRLAHAVKALAIAEAVYTKAQVFTTPGDYCKDQLLGVISVKDALVTVTKAMIKPLAEYAEEERMREIEERASYSE